MRRVYVFQYANYADQSTRKRSIERGELTYVLPHVRIWFYEKAEGMDVRRVDMTDIDCRTWLDFPPAGERRAGQMIALLDSQMAILMQRASQDEVVFKIPVRVLVSEEGLEEFRLRNMENDRAARLAFSGHSTLDTCSSESDPSHSRR